MDEENTMPDELLQQARSGDSERLGQLLELYRHYLHLLARVEIGRNLQAKLDASDLVQDTLMEAHRGFARFRGSNETQLICWLRQIMTANLSNLLRRYLGTQGRDVRRERELAGHVDQSSRLLDRGLIDRGSSPSQRASRREQAVLLADALEKIPEDYREAIVLRHLEGLTFPEVARRMGRSLDSVEKLWVRGLALLRQAMGEMS
jgi:RNA polymerase sigma-70 factor, ECF subfamily